MDNLYKTLINDKKDYNILDILEILPNIFNSNDIFFPEFKNDCNYNKIFDLLISNIKNSQLSEYLTKELIINFSPIIFEFIHLDDNLFDWIEKIIDEKCIFCSKIVNDYLICLICGKRICYSKICNKYYEHVKNCYGDICIFIRMNIEFAMSFAHSIFFLEIYPYFFKFPYCNSTPLKILIFASSITLEIG